MKTTMIPSNENWLRETKMIQLENGLNMAYMEAGDPEKPSMVLIHGISDSGRNWRNIMQELEDSYHIYAVDLRGFGKTDKSEPFLFTAFQFASDVKLFMDAAGIDSAYVCGHSMGSMVTQTLAFAYPEKVKAIVLVSSFAHMHETPADVREIGEYFGSMDIQGMSEEELLKEFQPDAQLLYDPTFVPGYLETLRGITGKIMRAAWYAMSINDNRNFLQYIKVPVMILWGTKDEIFTKEYQDELREYLPGAKFVVYEGIGHDIITQDPIRTAADIADFLGNL